MRHVFCAFTNPAEGREADFNAWYSQSHCREVVKYGRGFVGARRYRLDDHQMPGTVAPSWRYLALYNMHSDDLADYHRHPRKPDAPPGTPMNGLVDDGHVAWIFSPMGRRVDKTASGDIVEAPVSGEEQVGRGGERHLFFALANAEDGREAEFNEWYDNHHLREVVERIPGFVSGERYRLAQAQRPGMPAPPWRYLALYEVEPAGGAAVQAAISQAFQARPLTRPAEGIMSDRHAAWIYTPLGDYIE